MKTIVKIILVIAALFVVLWLMLMGLGLRPDECEQYRNTPVTSVPQYCVERLMEGM